MLVNLSNYMYLQDITLYLYKCGFSMEASIKLERGFDKILSDEKCVKSQGQSYSCVCSWIFSFRLKKNFRSPGSMCYIKFAKCRYVQL